MSLFMAWTYSKLWLPVVHWITITKWKLKKGAKSDD